MQQTCGTECSLYRKTTNHQQNDSINVLHPLVEHIAYVAP